MSETTEAAVQGTVATLPSAAAERFGELAAASHKVDGEWRETTFAQAGVAIEEIALGLIALGIQAGDRVGILADTRLEWTLASYGISAAGGVVVPVYPTNSPKECAWVLGNSGARAVVCETPEQRAKIDQVREELPALETTIGIEAEAGEMSLGQLRASGRDERPRRAGAPSVRRHARGPVHDHLHLGDDGAAQGRRAHARQRHVGG